MLDVVNLVLIAFTFHMALTFGVSCDKYHLALAMTLVTVNLLLLNFNI